MAEQTQAEKLREKIKTALKPLEIFKVDTDIYVAQILKACKEAGLMFTKVGVKGDLEGACICKVEEIEI